MPKIIKKIASKNLNLENITKVFESPAEGSAPKQIAIQGNFKYVQTSHETFVAPGVQVRDPFWAGEIKESLDDPERIANLQPVDLSSRGAKTQGRNKSGMSWKKGTSLRANRLNVSFRSKTVEQRLIERKQKISLKARVAELKNERIDNRRRAWADKKDNENRKKVNEMKSAKYTVINELSKTKKWKKAARKTLQKLPAEIFYGNFHTK